MKSMISASKASAEVDLNVPPVPGVIATMALLYNSLLTDALYRKYFTTLKVCKIFFR
jgi:hypothetical protein